MNLLDYLECIKSHFNVHQTVFDDLQQRDTPWISLWSPPLLH
jgi:hypothetical protein